MDPVAQGVGDKEGESVKEAEDVYEDVVRGVWVKEGEGVEELVTVTVAVITRE